MDTDSQLHHVKESDWLPLASEFGDFGKRLPGSSECLQVFDLFEEPETTGFLGGYMSFESHSSTEVLA